MEWRTIVDAEKEKPYYAGLKQKVEEEYRSTQVFPASRSDVHGVCLDAL